MLLRNGFECLLFEITNGGILNIEPRKLPRGRVLQYSLGGSAAGFAKVLPFTRLNFANFVTLYQTKNAQLFLISIFCEQLYTRPIFYDYPIPD